MEPSSNPEQEKVKFIQPEERLKAFLEKQEIESGDIKEELTQCVNDLSGGKFDSYQLCVEFFGLACLYVDKCCKGMGKVEIDGKLQGLFAEIFSEDENSQLAAKRMVQECWNLFDGPDLGFSEVNVYQSLSEKHIPEVNGIDVFTDIEKKGAALICVKNSLLSFDKAEDAEKSNGNVFQQAVEKEKKRSSQLHKNLNKRADSEQQFFAKAGHSEERPKVEPLTLTDEGKEFYKKLCDSFKEVEAKIEYLAGEMELMSIEYGIKNEETTKDILNRLTYDLSELKTLWLDLFVNFKKALEPGKEEKLNGLKKFLTNDNVVFFAHFYKGRSFNEYRSVLAASFDLLLAKEYSFDDVQKFASVLLYANEYPYVAKKKSLKEALQGFDELRLQLIASNLELRDEDFFIFVMSDVALSKSRYNAKVLEYSKKIISNTIKAKQKKYNEKKPSGKHAKLQQALAAVEVAESCGDLSEILGRMLGEKEATIMKAEPVDNDQGVEMVDRNQEDVLSVSETCSYAGVCREHGPVGTLKEHARHFFAFFGSENKFPTEIKGLRKKMEIFAAAEEDWVSGAEVTEEPDTKLPGLKS